MTTEAESDYDPIFGIGDVVTDPLDREVEIENILVGSKKDQVWYWCHHHCTDEMRLKPAKGMDATHEIEKSLSEESRP